MRPSNTIGIKNLSPLDYDGAKKAPSGAKMHTKKSILKKISKYINNRHALVDFTVQEGLSKNSRKVKFNNQKSVLRYNPKLKVNNATEKIITSHRLERSHS